MRQIYDKNGKLLRVGDVVHDDYGFDLIVQYDKKREEYYGKLVCDESDSCYDIPYFLTQKKITFVKHG